MTIINGHVLYDSEDIYNMLDTLVEIDSEKRNEIIEYIKYGDYGIDTRALINIVSDPLEYNVDYMDALDSDVSERFIEIMEHFGIA